MIRPTILLLGLVAFTLPAFAQKTNDVIAKQIRSLKADKTITLTSDTNTSKIMGSAESFEQKESSRAGIQAMNFGMAVFYPGRSLAASPGKINLTFWVMTKKPRFATDNKWTVNLSKGLLDLGSAGYAAKPGSHMEYLNFKISRSDLTKITAEADVKFTLGSAEFTFTPSQLTLLRNFLAVADVP